MDLSELVRSAGELQSAQRQTSAIQLYEDWLKTPQPLAHVARFNLAVLLTDSGNPAKAERHLRKAIEESPRFCQAYFNLGMAVERQGRSAEALFLWLKLTSIADQSKPDEAALVVAAFNQIGRLQEILKNYPQAESALYQSLSLDPKQPDALQHWVHLRQKQCKWPVYKEFGELREYDMMMATSPLAMLALTDDPLRQLISSHSFVARKFNFPVSKQGPKPYNHKKIRLGYVSGDFCTHAVGLLLPDFLEQHDRDTFELYAFDYSVEDGTTTRERIKNAFDHFFDIRLMSDAQVAARVRELEIDVLIDMHGLSSGCRPEIFATRPAVLQLTWLGFIGPTCFPWIDYVIADEYVLPKVKRQEFPEKVIDLANSFLPMTSSGINQDLLENPLTKVKKEGPVKKIGCFNNIYKVKPAFLDLCIETLKNNSDIELWLLEDNSEGLNQITNYFVKKGADLKRIKFHPRCSYKDYRKLVGQLDLYLDTFPYNGGSTIRDVISEGVPFITLSGPTMVSRMGGSVLTEAGLPQLIAVNWTEYSGLVQKYINQENFRLSCRKTLCSYLSQYAEKNRANVRSLEIAINRILQNLRV